METISYTSTVSISQGPSIIYKGEPKSDSYEKVSITIPAKNHRVAMTNHMINNKIANWP